jgi:rhodanese-related sulfurtransferase
MKSETHKNRFLPALMLVAAVGLAVMMLAFSLSLQPAATGFTLDAIEADVSKRFQEVAQLSADDLAAEMQSAKAPLLFDVRTEAEYRVSHLSGAERVDPETATDAFLAKYAAAAAGRDVVVYCSVGMRSSGLAAEVQEGLVKAGAASVANLRGGIFGWHNAKRPLVDASGATDFVHPFNDKWGALVARHEQMRTGEGK